MSGRRGDHASEAERSAFSGICEQCREPFWGRPDKRHCTDRCRAQASRARRARDVAETIARLARLAGVETK